MSFVLVILLPFLAVALVGGLVLAVVLIAQGRWRQAGLAGDLPLPERVDRHQRLMRALTIASVVMLLLALPLTAPATSLSVGTGDGATGVVPALLPLGVAILVVGLLLLGERAWPRPSGEVRTAPLTPRTLTSTSPARLRRLTLGWAAGLLALLAACGILGDGNEISASGAGADASVTSTAGPFPGWSYGLPTLAVAACLLALTWAALSTIRRRSAVATLAPAQDEALRRASSARVLRVTQAGLGLTLAGNAVFAGLALRSAGGGWPDLGIAGPWWGALGPWLVGFGLVVAVVALLALVPLPRRAGVEPVAVEPQPVSR